MGLLDHGDLRTAVELFQGLLELMRAVRDAAVTGYASR